jgi:hypothetical protein
MSHSYTNKTQTQYHILNGDALKQYFPTSISGEIIVARECLVDGNVQGDNFETLMNNRAAFICQYPECTADDYFLNTVPEFKKMIHLNSDCEVTCWFEDDLFCQVNFWYVLFLLAQQDKKITVYLTRPNESNEYSFGDMSLSELTLAFKHRTTISAEQLAMLAELWPSYQNNDHNKLRHISESLEFEFPFLLPAVVAHIDRTPDETGLGYPERVLLEIINKQEQPSFPTSFRMFHQQMALYSFGDLQVKAMYDRLMNVKKRSCNRFLK